MHAPIRHAKTAVRPNTLINPGRQQKRRLWLRPKGNIANGLTSNPSIRRNRYRYDTYYTSKKKILFPSRRRFPLAFLLAPFSRCFRLYRWFRRFEDVAHLSRVPQPENG